MSNYVTLMGAEDVRRAGHEMASAAQTMVGAASNIDSVLWRHQQFLEDWLIRLEQIMEKHAEA